MHMVEGGSVGGLEDRGVLVLAIGLPPCIAWVLEGSLLEDVSQILYSLGRVPRMGSRALCRPLVVVCLSPKLALQPFPS